MEISKFFHEQNRIRIFFELSPNHEPEPILKPKPNLSQKKIKLEFGSVRYRFSRDQRWVIDFLIKSKNEPLELFLIK